MSVTLSQRRRLEATVIIAGGFYSLILDPAKKKSPIENVIKTFGYVGLTLAAIMMQDKLVQQLFTRGWVRYIVQPILIMEAAYTVGFIASAVIDGEDGINNFNSFLRTAVTSPSIAAEVTVMSAIIIEDHLTSGNFVGPGQEWDEGVQELESRYQPLITAFGG